MTDEQAQALRRENAYLKGRVVELQDDVADLGGQVARLQQVLERAAARPGGPA